MLNKYKYYEWDEEKFVIPQKYYLKINADLADALNVFWSAGGFDFFNISNPKYYSQNWLDFISTLYNRINNGEFIINNKIYIIPLSDKQKEELSNRGVPSIFITNIEGN